MSYALTLLTALLVGVALGVVLGWFIRQAKSISAIETPMEGELRRQLRQTQSEL